MSEAAASVLDLNSLPEDIRGEPSLSSIKTIPDLAKSYVSAQKLIGVDKLPKPQKTWTEQQWNDFYKNLGRPDAPDSYSFKPDEELTKRVPVDENRLKDAKAALHKAGLTDRQANDVLKYYLDSTVRQHDEVTTAQETAKQQAITTLKGEWGDNYDMKINIAKSVVQKFSSPEMKDALGDIGNNPVFIKLFAKIGEAMMDDNATGDGSGLIVGDRAQALQELNGLKADPDFLKILTDRTNPGRKAALERWEALHQKAYPAGTE